MKSHRKCFKKKRFQPKNGCQDTMKELKERTDDMSEFERTMTNVQLDMKDVKDHMNKVTEALSKISDDNNTRDRRFEELIQSINNGLQDRDMKTDKKIESLGRKIDTKIEEKFAGLETRINVMKKQWNQDIEALTVHKAKQGTFRLNAKQC